MLGRLVNLVGKGFWPHNGPNVSVVVPLGATQAAAAGIGDADVVVTSGGTATTADGVRLAKPQKGDIVFVRHPGAYTLDVWPAKGDKINGGSTDAVYTGVTTGKCCLLVAISDTEWAAMVG